MSEDKYALIHKNRKQIFTNNFIGGIAWGLGATFGVSLIVAILGFIATQANLVPVVGSFVSEIIDFVLQHNQSIRIQ